MSNPYINPSDDATIYASSVNQITPDDLGDVILPLTVLKDILIENPVGDQVQQYNSTLKKSPPPKRA